MHLISTRAKLSVISKNISHKLCTGSFLKYYLKKISSVYTGQRYCGSPVISALSKQRRTKAVRRCIFYRYASYAAAIFVR